MSKLDDLIQKLCPDGVEYKTLSEVFDTRNGYTPSKKEKNFWENGTIPWFRMEDIRENGGILDKATQYVSQRSSEGQSISSKLYYCGNIGNNWRACTNYSAIDCESEIYIFDDKGTI